MSTVLSRFSLTTFYHYYAISLGDRGGWPFLGCHYSKIFLMMKQTYGLLIRHATHSCTARLGLQKQKSQLMTGKVLTWILSWAPNQNWSWPIALSVDSPAWLPLLQNKTRFFLPHRWFWRCVRTRRHSKKSMLTRCHNYSKRLTHWTYIVYLVANANLAHGGAWFYFELESICGAHTHSESLQ